MNIENLLNFIFSHNVLIIEILFAISLIGVFYLSFRIFAQAETDFSSSPDWKILQDNIKKILESSGAGRLASAGSAPAGGFKIPEGASESEVVQELQTQLERFQLQVVQKDQEIEQLKTELNAAHSLPPITVDSGAPVAAAASTASSGSADSAQYEEKIKDLEARLNEYSIIEDDIADLSFYKEETVRLQSEVDKLKAQLESLHDSEGEAPPSPKVAEIPTAPSPAAAPEVPSVASQPPPAPIPTPVAAEPIFAAPAAPTPAPAPAPAEDETDFIDNDIMAEFERAVAEQKASSTQVNKTTTIDKMKADIKQAEVDSAIKSASPNIESAEQPTVELDSNSNSNIELGANNNSNNISEIDKDNDNDNHDKGNEKSVIAEEIVLPDVKSPDTEDSNSSDNVVDVNFDKMLSEAQSLNENNEADGADSSVNAIENSLDTDKLLQEASGMDDENSDAKIKKEGA